MGVYVRPLLFFLKHLVSVLFFSNWVTEVVHIFVLLPVIRNNALLSLPNSASYPSF
jgi:hypothetical protein